MLAGAALAGSIGAVQAATSSAATLSVSEASFSLLNGRQLVETVATGGPLAALGTDGTLVVWQVDDGRGDLGIRSLTGDRSGSDTVAAGIEADAICLARIDPDLFDLFLVDGDGGLHHYWLRTSPTPVLQPVRTLAVNPDAAGCAVSDERVYVLNPPMGIVAFARSAETDPIMELVYAGPPAGAGTVEPAAFRLDPGAAGVRFTVWDADGRAWQIDPGRPAVASPVTAAEATIPLLSRGRERAAQKLPAVAPSAETTPVPSAGDAADDPAILVNAAGAVWILGTNKRQGLHVYDIDGRERHRVERGRVNNVDAVQVAADEFLVAASNRTERTLDFYRASLAEDRFEFVGAEPLDLNDPYGLCMARLPDGRTVVAVGGTDGRNQIWTVDPQTLTSVLLREIELDSQSEGCVIDAAANRVYIGEEAVGIWSVELDSGERRLFAGVEPGLLVPDVEGMDIYRQDDRAWLVVSSQGDDTFVIYALDQDLPPVKLRIAANHAAGIDGVSETDGLAVSNRALPGYPEGILVVQDGRNRAPAEAQNFKIVDWREIEALLPRP